MTKPGEE